MTIKDGDWTLMEWDRYSGRSVWSMYDGEKTIFRVDYPIDATLAENKAMRNAADKAWKGDYHLIASIPLNMLYDEKTGLIEAAKQQDDRYLSKWLNDGDNRAFRTKEGTV